jgi:hypothetical protein
LKKILARHHVHRRRAGDCHRVGENMKKETSKPIAKLELDGFVVHVGEPVIEYREKAQKILPLNIYPINTQVDFDNYPVRDVAPASTVMVVLPTDMNPQTFITKLSAKIGEAAPERGFDNIAAVQQAVVQTSEAITKETTQITTSAGRPLGFSR